MNPSADNTHDRKIENIGNLLETIVMDALTQALENIAHNKEHVILLQDHHRSDELKF